jgi:hypothetical protein
VVAWIRTSWEAGRSDSVRSFDFAGRGLGGGFFRLEAGSIHHRGNLDNSADGLQSAYWNFSRLKTLIQLARCGGRSGPR